MLLRIWNHRGLLLSLVRRQYQVRYRQSFVGLAWAIVPSLALLAMATLVFDKVAEVDTGTTSYPIFALSALAPWTFFANSLGFGVPSVVAEKVIITRLAFPRAVLPLSMVGVALMDLVASGLVFVAFAYTVGDGLPLTALWFPVPVLILILLVGGIVMLLSAINVFARDVKMAVPLMVQLWLFLTPVMYPLSEVPERLHSLYMANPMTGLVITFRRILVYGQPPDPGILLPAVVGALVALVVGIWYFGSTESRFADAI